MIGGGDGFPSACQRKEHEWRDQVPVMGIDTKGGSWPGSQSQVCPLTKVNQGLFKSIKFGQVLIGRYFPTDVVGSTPWCKTDPGAKMAYPTMSAEVYYNANIAILTCQLFMMVTALIVTVILSKKAAPTPQRIRQVPALSGTKL